MMTRRILQSMLKFSRTLFIATVILVCLIIISVYMTDNLHIRGKRQIYNYNNNSAGNDYYKPNQSKITFNDIINYHQTFNISGQDLLVLLHIQKTGGTTFERHLVYDLEIENPCSCSNDKRRCLCLRSNQKNVYETWLISRFSTGWSCGLHADWTQLTDCLRGLQRLFFMTFLRHPLHRFISEFRHVQRGATWRASKSHCHSYNTQLCYNNRSSWQNVTLEEFLKCPHNMAINRQTQMLANHHSLTCNNGDDKSSDQSMLSSAMDNLKDIAFFGICEQQRASQLLFEKSFNLKFKEDFTQSEDNKTRNMIEKLSNEVRNKILELNYLDIELYKFALKLFASRCKQLMGQDCDKFLENLKSLNTADNIN